MSSLEVAGELMVIAGRCAQGQSDAAGVEMWRRMMRRLVRRAMIGAGRQARQHLSTWLGESQLQPCMLRCAVPCCSYERWDSARKMWGQVLNRSRDMVIQVRNIFSVLA